MNNKNTEYQQAFDLYFSTGNTQKQIADTVGVSEKTMCAWVRQGGWERLKRAALQAPALVIENLQSQLVELQNHIMSREPGSRFPTYQEAEIERKLIASIDKLKWNTSLGQNMQMMKSYTSFTSRRDPEFTKQATLYAREYFTGKAGSDYKPYDMEYEAIPAELMNIPTKQPGNIADKMEVSNEEDAESIDRLDDQFDPYVNLNSPSMEVNLPLIPVPAQPGEVNLPLNEVQGKEIIEPQEIKKENFPPPPDWSLPIDKNNLPPGFGLYAYGTDKRLNINKTIDLRTGPLPRLSIERRMPHMEAKRFILRPGQPTIITDIGDDRASSQIIRDLFGDEGLEKILRQTTNNVGT